MKRKWWVILCGVLCAALFIGLVGTGDNRLLWTKTFTTSVRVVGLTPDGELAIVISNRLEVLNREGQSRFVREVAEVSGTRSHFVSTPDQGFYFNEWNDSGQAEIVKCDWQGNELWRHEVSGRIERMAFSNAGEVLATTRLGALAMLRADGTRKYERSTKRRSTFMRFVGDGHVVFRDEVTDQLIFLNPEGNETGSYPYPTMFSHPLFAVHNPAGGLVGADHTGAFAVDVAGNPQWMTALPPPRTMNLYSVMLDELINLQTDERGNVLLQHRSGSLHVLDSIGNLRWSQSTLPSAHVAKIKHGRDSAGFVIAHQEFRVLMDNPANPRAGKVGFAAGPAKVASLTADGQLRWTQRLPGKLEWKWHQTYWDWRVAWANRFGRNTYQNLSPPLVALDGTIYVHGSTQNTYFILAIRGDPPAE